MACGESMKAISYSGRKEPGETSHVHVFIRNNGIRVRSGGRMNNAGLRAITNQGQRGDGRPQGVSSRGVSVEVEVAQGVSGPVTGLCAAGTDSAGIPSWGRKRKWVTAKDTDWPS